MNPPVDRRVLMALRRLLVVGAAAALVLAGLAAVPTPAYADTSPAAGLPATVSDDPLAAPQIDGVAWTQIIVGNTVYVGGKFSNAQPAGAAAGVDTVTRADMLAYDITTGALLPFAPAFNADVRGLAASPDGSVIYAVGSFTSVNGSAAYRVVALNSSTGKVISTFKASLNATAYAVSANGTGVYVGGIFTAADGQTRTRAAAFSPSSGAALPFAPVVPDYTVRAILVSPDGGKVALGGSFTSLNSSSSPGAGDGLVDAATGRTDLPWAVGAVVSNSGSKSAIYSLTTDGTYVYGTGYSYQGTGPGRLEGTFSASWDGGTIRLLEACHGDTYSAAPAGDVFYLAGHPHYCADLPNGYRQMYPQTNQRALAFTTAPTGTLRHTTINPSYYVDFAGQPAPTLLDWYPTLQIGTVTGQNQAAWTVAANSKYVVYGGEFPTVNGVRQAGLVRFAVKSIAPNTDGPQLSGSGWTVRASSQKPGTVRIDWPANYDRDNAALTYTLLRDGVPVYSTTRTSQLQYRRPVMSFLDAGLDAGSAHSYRVRATDSTGNSALSGSTSVRVSASKLSSSYEDAVLADNPSDFWRLNEPAGATTLVDSAGPYDLTAGSGVTLGTSGVVAGDEGTAGSFSGKSGGSASTAEEIGGSDTFSLEAWFRTTTTTGGKIIGLGSVATGLSSLHDREIDLDSSGHVSFAVWPGSTQTVSSGSRTYRDGKWHAVVATLSSAGMKLYMDGTLVGSRSGVTYGQGTAGYWRVGGDAAYSGDGWFDGDLDNVAVYNESALNDTQVSNHYNAGISGVLSANAAPTASFTSSVGGSTASFDGSGSSDSDGTISSYSWDYGDGSPTGSGVTTKHSYAAAGTYSVRLTVTDNGGATGTVSHDVTVSPPLASDTFTRTVSNGLGTADTGGAWTVGGGSSHFSVNGSAARLSTPAGGTLTASLSAVSSSTTDARAAFTLPGLPVGGSVYGSVVARQLGSGGYSARVVVTASGAVTLQLRENDTTMKAATVNGLTVVAGDTLHLEAVATGVSPTTIEAKVWKQGSTTPASWLLTTTDSTAGLQTSGGTGIVTYTGAAVSNGPYVWAVDDFVAEESK